MSGERKRRRLIALLGVVAVAVTASPMLATPAGAELPPRAETILRAAARDLDRYWATEFPALYGAPYPPMGRIVAAGPTTKVPDCQGRHISYRREVHGNAFYCLHGNYIAYDEQGLFPALARTFGDLAPALVLAHEWGHAIQDRAGVGADQPSILVELQADCFAGSWAQRVATHATIAVRFEPTTLDEALAAYLSFRDAVGATPSSRQAHGDAFDRINAFQTGFEHGAPACKPFFDAPPPITEQEFTSAAEAASGGNLPEAEVLPSTLDLLHDVYTQVAPLTARQVHPVRTSVLPRPATCGGRSVEAPLAATGAVYCAANRTIVINPVRLDEIYRSIGDFGVAVLVGDAYARYAADRTGRLAGLSGRTAALLADCSTGAWAGAFANAPSGLPSPSLKTTLTLAPGDLDKVIEAFIASDAETQGGAGPGGSVFRRVEAFRLGYFGGFAACNATYRASA